jgi:hypothetical protein
MVDLIKNKWYECLSQETKWIFKFSNSKKYNLSKFPCSKAGTPKDRYTTRNLGYMGSYIKNVQFADIEEVYKLFPEEKPKFIIIEIW